MDSALEAVLRPMTDELRKALGDDLAAVVVYGSAVGGGYKPGKSNANVLVVLSRVTAAGLARAGEVLDAPRDVLVVAHIARPDELAAMCRTFPIQLAEMKDHHEALFGEPTLAGVEVTREALLADAERELAGVSRRLQRGLAQHPGDARAVAKAVRKNFRSLVHALRGALRAEGDLPPTTDKHPTLERAAKRFDLDGPALVRLLDFRRRNETVSRAGLVELADALLSNTERASAAVAKLR